MRVSGHSDRRGAVDGRQLAVGGLVAVIAGALGLSAYIFWGGRGGRASADPTMRFECQKCGKEFSLRPEELAGDSRASRRESPGQPRPDCPGCKAKGSGLRMAQCPDPKCGAWYVPGNMKDGGGAMPTVRGGDVCPRCGVDRAKWFDRNRSR